MATQAANIQLLGGMLSMAPSNGANALLSKNIQGTAPSSNGFYSLWVGLTQGQPLDSALANLERQASGEEAAPNGSFLPPAFPSELLPADLLKKIENLHQLDSSTNPEAYDDVISHLKESLQNMLAMMESQGDINDANFEKLTFNQSSLVTESSLSASSTMSGSLEDGALSDEQLLAYLQLTQQQLAQQYNLERTEAVNTSATESALSTLSLLSEYVEQKLAVNSDNSRPTTATLTDTEQNITEERITQLWMQLETARQLREEASKQSSSSDVLEEELLRKSSEQVGVVQGQGLDSSLNSGQLLSLGEDESINQDIMDQEALARDQLTKEAIEQLIEQQNTRVITDTQSQQNSGVSERIVSPPLAPLNPLSQASTEKSADRVSEPRGAFIPSAPLPVASVNELTPAERVAASEMISDGGRRALTDAISQAIAQRTSVEDTASDSLRRQEVGSAATTLIADTQKMTQSPPSLAQSPLAQANNSQDALMQKMLNPQWSQALGERAVMMAQQGPRLAEVRLDPPELGSLRIKVQVHANDQVSLTFNAPNASVREVLEQNLPRLREMFAEQGMNLADASVSDQSREKHSEQSQSRYLGRGDSAAGEDFGEMPASRMELRKLGIIDYYA